MINPPPEHVPAELPQRAEELLKDAIRRYRGTVFWNMQPEMTVSGLRSAAQALRTRGDLEATRLADELIRSVIHAS